MSVFTISRGYGLYEDEIIREFASRAGFMVFSQDLLVEVAREIELPLEEVKTAYDMESFSSFKTFIREIIQSFNNSESLQSVGAQSYMPEFYPLYYPFMNLSGNKPVAESQRSYKDIMAKVIKEIAAKDNVIIIGRGAQVILKDLPNCYHLRLEGVFEKKIARIMEKENLDEKEAINKVKSLEKHRSAYMDYFYNVDNLDPSLYHFVVNMDLIGSEKFIKFLDYLAK